jgi:hypothetical protein
MHWFGLGQRSSSALVESYLGRCSDFSELQQSGKKPEQSSVLAKKKTLVILKRVKMTFRQVSPIAIQLFDSDGHDSETIV